MVRVPAGDTAMFRGVTLRRGESATATGELRFQGNVGVGFGPNPGLERLDVGAGMVATVPQFTDPQVGSGRPLGDWLVRDGGEIRVPGADGVLPAARLRLSARLRTDTGAELIAGLRRIPANARLELVGGPTRTVSGPLTNDGMLGSTGPCWS